jgi:hypothetical protein
MSFFPTSPVNGQQANVGNITYQWNSTTAAWNRVGTTVTNIIDGITVNITGNLNATGTGQQTFAGRISSGGNISASGNIQGAHIIASQTMAAGGNITSGGNIIASGAANVSTLNASLVNATTQVAVGSAYLDGSQLVVNNVNAGNAVTSPYISTTTLLASNAALTSATVTGNITAGNISTTGSASHSGNITVGNVIATGNVSGTFILGNGAFLTGVVTGGGGGGAGNRANISATVGPLSNAVSINSDLTGYKGYALYKIATSAASWIRVYTSSSARTADATRTQDVDPQPGAGVIAEIISTGANTVIVSPAAVGFNDDTPVSNTVPIAITNLSGAPATITVTLTMLQLET